MSAHLGVTIFALYIWHELSCYSLTACDKRGYHTKQSTVKPVLSGLSKIDKIKVLKTNGSLMKVESIAECSLGAFCNTFDLH